MEGVVATDQDDFCHSAVAELDLATGELVAQVFEEGGAGGGVQLVVHIAGDQAGRAKRTDFRLERSVVGHCIVQIGDCQDAGVRVDLVTAQLVRVAAAIHPFVMLQNCQHYVHGGGFSLAQQFDRQRTMLFHLRHFFVSQFFRLGNQLFRNLRLANVVQEAGQDEIAQRSSLIAQPFAEHAADHTDADRMMDRVFAESPHRMQVMHGADCFRHLQD